MGESIHFAGWQEDDPAPEICPLCQEASPIFKYQVVPAPDADTAQNLQGYCCLRCGQQLLATLEQVTLARWAGQSPRLRSKKTPE